MQMNVNDYQIDEFKKKFICTETYQKIISDYDCVVFEKNWKNPRCVTPRQFVAQRQPSYFSAVPFYYLDFLLEKNPKKIYDIGCGWNIFKKYIPNIIGIGAEDPKSGDFYGDIHDYVDDDFISHHQNYFESMFSINSLHFVPLTNLKTVVLNFYSMLTTGGTGWLALNVKCMRDRDLIKFEKSSIEDLDSYIRNEIYNIGIEYLVVDIDLSVIDEFMNGNIRLIMQKK